MNAALKGLVLTLGTFGLIAAPTAVLAASPPVKSPPAVRVENTRPVPVVVYLERGELDTRLGTVAPDATKTLALPRYVDQDQEARVLVQPKDGFDLSSQDITVPKAGTLNVLVPENSSGYMPPPADVIPNPGVGTTTMTVENPRNDKVTVYVEYGDFDTKIGTVPADGIITLDIPAWLTRDQQDVTVFLHPHNGLDLETGQFTLKKGAHLEVKVPLT